LLYSKNKINLPEILVDFDLEKARKFYKHKDENFEKLGYYRTHPLEAVKSFDLRNNLRFPVVAPDGTEVFPQRQWRWSKERFDEALQKNEVIFNKNTNNQWVLSSKQYLNNENGEQRKTKTQSLIDDIFTQQGTKEIFEILGDSKIFSFPKPSSLIKRILYFFSQQDNAVTNNDLILDFFAGSGTTAHAVMQLNAEDGGNRKFILCQWDEAIDPKTSKPAYDFCIENNFAPVISSITLERVNRAGDKIKAENKNKNIDIGYKVFSLIDKPKVNYDATHEPTFFLNRTRETALDTLVNMLVATCQTLDTKIETIKENAIYKANNEIYVTGTITADDLEGFKDLKINIDALADINLTDYMNINLNFGDNMTVIF
jgi:adenine-specific DNA-methyltransferase